MAKKYFKIDLFVNAGCVLNTSKKKVVVDTYAAGVRFDAGATYTVEYEAGFVKGTGDNEFLSPANTNAGSFTTNSTGPQVQSDVPSGSSVTNNTFIRYTYDRQILAGDGNYYLYKVGSPDVLLQTYNPSDSTANNTISGTQITLDTTGLIDANETYYVLIDQGAVEDKDGLAAFGFNNDQEHRWTTAASTNVDFPDLTSLKVSSATLSCTITKNPNYENLTESFSSTFTSTLTGDPVFKGINDMIAVRSYDRDTSNQIFEFTTPYIEEGEASGDNYTIEFSATGGEFGDEDDLYNSSSTYSFTGSITQANAKFDKILFYPPNGISGGTSYTMTYTQKRNNVTQLTRTVALNNTNNDVDNTTRYVYLESNQTYVPDRTLQLYKSFHFLVVGAGGGGAGFTISIGGGGGGGGEVIYSVHEGISNPTAFSNITGLNISIGSGGARGALGHPINTNSNGQNGSTGGSTTMTINYTNSTTATYTANGGDGGTASSGSLNSSPGGDEGGGRYNGGSSYHAGSNASSVIVYAGGGAGAGDLWYTSNGYAGTGFSASANSGTSLFPGYGFNKASQTNWGDNYLYGQGGPGTYSTGTGFLGTGDKSNESAQFNYLGSGGTFQTTAGETIYQRGQGGAGAWGTINSGNCKDGTDGQDGVVVLKYF